MLPLVSETLISHFLRVDIDVSSRPANLYIAGAIRHADRPPHLGNRDVAFLIPDRQRSPLGTATSRSKLMRESPVPGSERRIS